MPRKSISYETYIESIDEIIEMLDKQIYAHSISSKRVVGVKALKGIRKRVIELKKKTKYVTKQKRVRNGNATNIKKEYNISDSLREFLNVDEGTKLSRQDVISALCTYIHIKPDESRESHLRWSYLNLNGERNLQDTENKKRIIPDEKLSNLLNYEKYMKDINDGLIVTKNKNGEENIIKDPNIYYLTLQRLITPHMLKDTNHEV